MAVCVIEEIRCVEDMKFTNSFYFCIVYAKLVVKMKNT